VYHQKMDEGSLRLARETQDVVERLRQAAFDHRNTQREIDIDFCKPVEHGIENGDM